MSDRPVVAMLGLGAMGARMASRLLGDELDLRVWSRSGVPAEFPALSSRFAATPAEAARAADIVLSMVTDDQASRAVWVDGGVLGAMRADALAIECSTLSPAWVTELATLARRAGPAFLDAPVLGTRPQAESGSLVFLIGGEPSSVERASPVLSRLGGHLHHLGPSPAGARAKLIANALFTAQVAMLAELLGLARRTGGNPEGLLKSLADTPITSPVAKAAASAMLARTFAPMFPLRLAAQGPTLRAKRSRRLVL